MAALLQLQAAATTFLMRFVRALHKWIALAAALQVCLWVMSGLVMSLLDHHVVSGESTARAASAPKNVPREQALLDPQALLRRDDSGTVRSIELRRQLETWVWRVTSDVGVRVYDAVSGAPISVDEARARAIAAADIAADVAPSRAVLLTTSTLEARGHAPPLWRVDFNDAQQTRYYIAVDDGRILERRTGDWRVFDVFWMLHTMDYRTRDDFNNPWAVTFAFLAVWLAISGVILLFRSFRRRARRTASSVSAA